MARANKRITKKDVSQLLPLSFWSLDRIGVFLSIDAGDERQSRISTEPQFDDSCQLMPEGNPDLGNITGYYKQWVTPTEIDFRRASSSVAFRALKDKTQVFPCDKSNNVRTRMSHSQEVAMNADTILSGVLAYARTALNGNGNTEIQTADNCLGSDSVEFLRYALRASCLLHDAGNPPFGHFGEKVIGEWFASLLERDAKNDGDSFRKALHDLSEEYAFDLTHFEGNANSLRIALRSTGLFDGRRMNLTGTTLAAIIKYPWYSSECKGKDKVKYNFFKSDEWAIEQMSQLAGVPRNLKDGERHPLSLIMEASDDISYVTGDFEDAFRKGKFGVSEAVEHMLRLITSYLTDEERGHTLTKRKDRATKTYALVYLLALIAGSKEDLRKCDEFCETIKEKGFADINYHVALKKDSHPFDYLLIDPKDLAKGTQHTYMSACEQLSDYSLDATQRRQLQETYVARWVDIVRKWLCYSAARSLSSEEIRVFSGSDIECNKSVLVKTPPKRSKREGNIDMAQALFGGHALSVEVINGLIAEYVYDGQENLQLNSRAQTVVGGLLESFIPAALECVVADLEKATKKTLLKYDLINPLGVPDTSRNLLKMIPLRYRMDYHDRFSASFGSDAGCWQGHRQSYELCMMVLDYITSLSDEAAIDLYHAINF